VLYPVFIILSAVFSLLELENVGQNGLIITTDCLHVIRTFEWEVVCVCDSWHFTLNFPTCCLFILCCKASF